MNNWKITQVSKLPKIKNPILIEGLPGIGNVGKVAVDFIIDELKAKKIYELFSYTFPHSVFVNEKNLVELPSIEIYHAKLKNNDLFLLAGDVQPIDEISCYEFSERILDVLKDYKNSKIITLGGIGLQDIPKKPKVYCTGNSEKAIKEFITKGVIKELHGIVGPIVGVSGLLLGLSKKRKIDAVCYLAETYGHPMYLGVKGARAILKSLNEKLKLGINLNDLDKEIRDLEVDVIKKSEELSSVSKKAAIKKLKDKIGEEVNYIG